MTLFVLWLFGMTAIGAACNAPSWGILLYSWFRPGSPRDLDRLTIRLGLTVGSIGTLLGAWVRASSIIEDPERMQKPFFLITPWATYATSAWIIAAWLILLLLAELCYLTTSMIACRRVGKRAIAPVVCLLVSIMWTALVLLWSII